MSVLKMHVLQRALSLMGNKYMQHAIKNASFRSSQFHCSPRIEQNGASFVILCNIFRVSFTFSFNNTWRVVSGVSQSISCNGKHFHVNTANFTV